ncbi:MULTISPECIES: CheR family methyltransferase [Olivibacter]|jgi:chemotaxis protein methyltransferase CheR|uniref:CheR family methyltransferase n=1 Tax=Olivibacter oleidegradans TaxID=760123 RepID=A0ABV6HEB2_9SPHI|nr:MULTISPECIES: protein-glutamate O-methyltransferase CheR [Olivibacter]QEK99720.1 protein-glutamate O-methyltransferase CheR [Olivibacter sp. LS-1]
MWQFPAIEDTDLETLINDLLEIHGYDFRNYSRASLKRQVNRLFTRDRFPSFAEMRYRLKVDKTYLKRFVEGITVNVTEMFRDAEFYKFLRAQIIPTLGTYPFIRVWVAGCSTGEEAYSIAILLKEANLLHKSLIYATDLNPAVLEEAKEGIFNLKSMKLYSENYILSGGFQDFSTYYTANYHHAILNQELSEKIIFSQHNLVSDGSFNEFQLISCRNVLIYFNSYLQNQVFSLFDDSLAPLGYLALGTKETLLFSSIANRYKQVATEAKIWRKQVFEG